jgi:hypothetical protein
MDTQVEQHSWDGLNEALFAKYGDTAGDVDVSGSMSLEGSSEDEQDRWRQLHRFYAKYNPEKQR